MDPDELLHLAGAPFTDEEVEAAVESVRAAAGWHIAPTRSDTITLTVGCREALLRLPTRQLVSVEEVTDLDTSTAIAASDYRVLTTLNKLLKRRGYWPTGYEAVQVEMTHGYTTWPKDLLPVVAEAAATSRRDQTVRSQQAGVFVVAYGDTGSSGVGSLTSTSAALDRYLLSQPGMA
jgi:hypothetical protein